MTRRAWITVGVLAVLLAVAALLRLMVGKPGELAWPETGEFFKLRITRVVAGLIVGAALGVGGVMLQCLLRNPLASPDLMGLASGAGLGVMVSMYVAGGGQIERANVGADAGSALLGALGALGIVYLLSQRRGLLDPVTLVLMGVVVGIVCGAATMFIQQLMPDRGVAAARWFLGAIRDDLSATRLWLAGGATAGAILFGVMASRAMDASLLGDDEARSVGVPLDALRVGLFVGSGVLAAASVVLAGPVGFVGLIAPHVVRLAAGPHHRGLVIGSALAGAALVIGADALVKSVSLASGRLPIGVVTSMLGGPVLIGMLRRGIR